MLSREKLIAAFQNPLPGFKAQVEMAPFKNPSYREPKPDAKIAAVMAIINWQDALPHLVLIKRTPGAAGDKHAGQISFPGGKAEPDDASLLDTALREAQEEIGVQKEQLQILGPLTTLYIPVSGFLVHPFVAIGNIDRFVLQEDEVADILQWPLQDLLSYNAIHTKDIRPRPGISLKDVPYFDCMGHVLWGATAMMLSELRTMLKSNQ